MLDVGDRRENQGLQPLVRCNPWSPWKAGLCAGGQLVVRSPPHSYARIWDNLPQARQQDAPAGSKDSNQLPLTLGIELCKLKIQRNGES